MIFPAGRTATYAYNGANQVTGISDWSGGLTQHVYDGNGRLVTTIQ
nr:hypothetical protein [Oscillochloris trichoides]